MIVTLLYEPRALSDQGIGALTRSLDNARVSYQLVDVDSPTGVAQSELYELTQRPAVLITEDDGRLIQAWQGVLPTADEIGYSAHL